MPVEFDYLHRWLGIPPREQPPTLYRLLGLAPFEEDPDVIAMAADRQMAHVRNFQSGPHGALAEKLLNELASAQITLLNRQKKQVYDAQQHAISAASAAPFTSQTVAAEIDALLPPSVAPIVVQAQPPKLIPIPVAPPSLQPAVPLRPVPLAPVQARVVQVQSLAEPEEAPLWPTISMDSPLLWQLPVGALALVLVVMVGWQVVKALPSNEPEPLQREIAAAPRKQPEPVVKAEATPVTPPMPEQVAPVVEPVAPPPEKQPAEKSAAPDAFDPPEEPEPKSVPVVKKTEPTDPKTDPSEPEKPLTPAEMSAAEMAAQLASAKGAGRLAVPDDAALRTARSAMQEVYAKDFNAATTAANRKLLAEKLVQEARKFENDPSGTYALLLEAKALAIEAGQPKLVLEIVDELVARFQLESLTERSAAVVAVVPHVKTLTGQVIVAEQCQTLVDEAMSAENYTLARSLVELGMNAATKANDRESIKELTGRREELARWEALHKKVKEAEAILAQNPGDADASLFLGMHLCLTKNDWEAGLPMLAKATGKPVAEIARADLRLPTDAAERVAVGDRWWTYASENDEAAKQFKRRAVYWYKLALPELVDLTRNRINARLADNWTGPTGGPEPAISPLLAEAARERQVKWAHWAKVPVVKTNTLGMRLMLIPPGQFRMGAASAIGDQPGENQPQHVVRITKPFYVGASEVTVDQFAVFVKSTSYKTEFDKRRDEENQNFNGFNFGGRGNGNRNRGATMPSWLNTSYVQTAEHPVVNITWNDAQAFCGWLSQREGTVYSLPTEAQWEYACRAGTDTQYSFGDTEQRLDSYAWHLGNSPKSPQRVGQKRPNAWGLRDAHGNAAEWCADYYSSYTGDLAEDPTGMDFGRERVVRGGSWGHRTAPKSAARDQAHPESGDERIGFRVVSSIDAAK